MKFPGFLEDGAAAFAWTVRNAASIGGDANRVFVMGHSAAAPPALLVTGNEDRTVLPQNSERLAVRLRASGVPVTEPRYPDLGHITIVGSLAAPLRGGRGEELLGEIERFVKR